jgi:hypothetical protein
VNREQLSITQAGEVGWRASSSIRHHEILHIVRDEQGTDAAQDEEGRENDNKYGHFVSLMPEV